MSVRILILAFLVSLSAVVFCVHLELQNGEKITKLRPSNDPSHIKFYLYSNPEDEDERTELKINNYSSVVTSGYKTTCPLVILIHGVLSDSLTFPDVKIIKNEYLRERVPVNIVMVDFGDLTTSILPTMFSALSYMVVLQGYNNTEAVGSQVTDFISFMTVSKFVSGPENVHLIGFSIGAHMAGVVGRNIFYRTYKKIGRITGLDPSPQFKSQHKLVETDAEFVDVTLSAMGLLARKKSFGHVHFYMNGGGPHQPNCPNLSPFVDPYCSHVNAVYYYAKTIRMRKPIFGCECEPRRCKTAPQTCENPIRYGEQVTKSARGNFYVAVN